MMKHVIKIATTRLKPAPARTRTRVARDVLYNLKDTLSRTYRTLSYIHCRTNSKIFF